MKTSEAFERLDWEWDRGRSLRMIEVLERHLFVAKGPTLGDAHIVRTRLAGAVRVMDEVGNALLEARNHLAAGRLRAAACMCGIELERALKNLCTTLDAEVRARLQTIADYNTRSRQRRRTSSRRGARSSTSPTFGTSAPMCWTRNRRRPRFGSYWTTPTPSCVPCPTGAKRPEHGR